MSSLIASNSIALTVLLIALVILIIVLTVLATMFVIGIRGKNVSSEDTSVKEAEATVAERPTQRQNFLVSLPSTYQQQVKEEPKTEELASEDPVLALSAPEEKAEEQEEEEPEALPEPEDDDEDDEEDATFVTEGRDKVRYERSFTAKLIQNKDEVKEWYSEIKNELLSYHKVRDRMSWKRETYRRGRNTVARFVVRGKTLCLMLAADPKKYEGSKFAVEDVSNVGTTSDTPCLYRIKSSRRAKYAKELIAEVMADAGAVKKPREAVDYYLPYDGTVGLMERGLVKRVVSTSSRTFKIVEMDKTAQAEAAASSDGKKDE